MAASGQWIVVGITGVTCGGKTTLANQLKNKFSNCVVLHQDNYFLPGDSPLHIKVQELNYNNTDVISCIDMKRMYEDVINIIELKGNEQNETSDIKKILIVEGFCLLNYKPIAELCNLIYAFILKKNVCLQRRINRKHRRSDVPGYFDLCVWPEHLKQHKDLKDQPGVAVVNGEDENVCEKVSKDIEMLLKR